MFNKNRFKHVVGEKLHPLLIAMRNGLAKLNIDNIQKDAKLLSQKAIDNVYSGQSPSDIINNTLQTQLPPNTPPKGNNNG